MKKTPKITPRQTHIKDENKRFYVMAPATVQFALQKEAFSRGTDLWTLAGEVLGSWVAAGYPDSIVERPADSEAVQEKPE